MVPKMDHLATEVHGPVQDLGQRPRVSEVNFATGGSSHAEHTPFD
jgi:hypothetical protein